MESITQMWLDKLRDEWTKPYRQALEEIDHNCSFGGDRLGMTEAGVQELRRIAQRALASPRTDQTKEDR
jgi:hypothetical protein